MVVAAPLTGSALIKALKGAQDPPAPGGPSKIALAAAAWGDTDLVVPRKADVIRDWVLEAWTRAKPGPRNPIADVAYHTLLVDVSRKCAAPAHAPLALLGTYISSAGDDDELGQAAAASLPILFGDGIKADAWADMLGRLATALQAGPWNSLAPAAKLVCTGLASSLPTSPNGKKIAQSLHSKLPALAGALHAHQAFGPELNPVLPSLFFSLGVLQTVEPLKQLLAALLPSLSPSSEALAPALAFIPTAFGAFIDATKQNQYTLYGKADKDKPLDVYIADRTRGAVIPALAAALDLLNLLEDGALARPSSSTAAPALGHDLWSARLALWERVLQWGGYLEADSKAAALVSAEARRGSAALAMYGASEGASTEEGLAGRVLRTLDALERLDHARSALGTDVVGWCLAAPERCHVPARILLGSILRYHVLTHSLEGYFVLVSDAARELFSPSLPPEALEPLYILVATGPLTERAFRADITAAVRAVNLGGRRGTVWAAILRTLASRTRDALEPETGGKRKRGVPACGARLAAVLSRLSKMVLDASARARAGDDEEVVEEAVAAFGDEWPAAPKKRKSMGGDDATELLLAARLRVARSARLLHRETEFVSHTQLVGATPSFTLPELRLEAFHLLYTALALSDSADGMDGVVDALLTTLTGPSESWSGRDATVGPNLAAAAWTLAAEGGLSVFESASAAQLDTLAGTIVARAGPAEGLSVGAAIARILNTAETWELPGLRAALLRALVAAAKAGSGFVVLAASPGPWLSKGARAALVAAAYDADAAGAERAAIRAWLARLAEGDVLGPLTEAGTLRRLLATASGAEDATLALLSRAFTALVRSAPREPAPLIAALSVLKKPFRVMDVRARAAAAFFNTTQPDWTGDLRAAAETLASDARRHLPPSSLGADVERWRAHLALARFEVRLGQRAPAAPLGPVLAARTAAPEALLATALSGDTEATLATYLALARGAGTEALDSALARIATSLSAEEYARALAALQPLLPGSEALRATRILVSAPVHGSGAVLASALPALLAALDGAPGSRTARQDGEREEEREETLRVVGALTNDRTGLLRPMHAGVLLAVIAAALVPDTAPDTARDATASVDKAHAAALAPLALAPLLTLARHRGDLLRAHLPAVVGLLATFMPLLQRARAGVRARLATEDAVHTAHAALLARTMGALAVAKISGTGAGAARTLAGPLAKHAPAVLVAYARAASDPWAALSSAVRRELEPGLFALADVITAGGRADGRGREGEGVGVPFGLGEAHGQAEREVWADLWKAWARKRYTGRG
ncbi:hypothetical protein CspeluHIS016_0309100 [Cutaneotrichosporon spelunceum]|uniref:Nucleolar 27S pre-rRNA processing Urb2/Npa2 C-terminal domain-containing protein n=1 Tax=Cutaneotrichosporon spelunceum TaxID=1672016 RepID=A0AAD3TV65_9TREE|nr:hypothetical protein CspeluHIS016_0309100 [Cutaneotrichosporon spelunceum]